MTLVRRFQVAPALVRLIRKERGGARRAIGAEIRQAASAARAALHDGPQTLGQDRDAESHGPTLCRGCDRCPAGDAGAGSDRQPEIGIGKRPQVARETFGRARLEPS